LSKKDDAHRTLTDQDPSAPHGMADQEPSSAAQDAPGATISPAPDPVQGFLTGEPGAATDQRWCKVCKALVRPIGKGQCERCNAFLALNFTARRHPINKFRKVQIREQLEADYRPGNTMLRSSCDTLAGILEQLEVLKPGSPDHQRLVQLSVLLGAALEESRVARTPEANKLETLSPSEFADHAENIAQAARDYLARLEWNHPNPALRPDEITLRHARQNVERAEMLARHTRADAEAPLTDAERLTEEFADVGSYGTEVPEPEVPEPPPPPPPAAPAAPAAPVLCQYCHAAFSGCVVIRDHGGWLATHQERPDVKAHLDAQAAERARRGWDQSVRRT